MSDKNLRIRILLEAAERVTAPLRAIMGGARLTGKELRATTDRLKALNAAQADIGRFRQLKGGLKDSEARLAAAQAKVAELKREMLATDAPSKKLAASFAKAGREAAAFKQDLNGQQAELQQLRDRMAAAGISTAKLATHERELRTEAQKLNAELKEQSTRLSAAEERAARFAQGRERFGNITNRATGMAAGGASAIATGMSLARPFQQADGEALAFQSRMTDIAQKADLTRGAARAMGSELLAAARAANQMPEAMQAGVDTLASMGMDPRRAVKMMTPIGRAATAYKAEIADLSAAAFSANDNLKVPVDQTARLIDVMAKAGKAGAFEMKDMAAHFPSLTASAQALGQKGVGAVADLAAALQITRKGAGDSASAANNLQNLLNKINAEDTVKRFKKFGVDIPAAMKRAAKDGKSPIEAIVELTKKATGGDLSKLPLLFGDAQVQAALRPLIQNVDLYRQIRADALKGGGTVDADFAQRMLDSAEKAKNLQIKLALLRQTIGDRLMPTFDMVRDKAAAVAARFTGWAERNPALSSTILTIIAAFAGLLLVAGGLAIAAAGLMAPFAALAWTSSVLGISAAGLGTKLMYPLKIFPLLLKGVWGLVTGIARAGLFLMANPVIAGILLLVAAVAFAGYMIWRHWDKIKAAFNSAVAVIGAALQSAWNWIKSTFSAILSYLGGLGARFFGFGANLIQGLINGITGKLAALKNTIIGAASSAANWFKNKLGIRSPSRVFMMLGGHVIGGLDRGLAANQDAPARRIAAIARNMAGAMALGSAAPALAMPVQDQLADAFQRGAALRAPPRPSGPSGRPSAASTFNVTIQIQQQPGQSADDLARAVARELQRIEREKRAAGNSRFADEPDYEAI